MSKPFENLLNKMSPERRELIEKKTDALMAEMALSELRQALEMTQQDLAETLNLNQAAVAKFEHQSDRYSSTLRQILRGMGANLKIVAQLPNG